MKEKLKFLCITLLLVGAMFVAMPAKANAATVYKDRYVRKNAQLFYYDKKGKLVKGFFVSPGKKLYYFDSKTGAVKSGLQKIGKYYYIINYKGALQIGRVEYKGKQYYCNSKGVMLTGWQTIGKKQYFFAKNGTMQYGWLTSGKNTYYLDEKTGEKRTGWLRKNGVYYCLHSRTGVLRRNTFINGKYIGREGYWIKNPEEIFTTIMGNSSISVSQMVSLYNKRNSKYPAAELKKGGAKDIKTFCTMILEEANLEGVRAEVLYAQIMLETNWLRFGGDVTISQFNFGGIGATGGGVKGNVFKSVRKGIRAQVQHLKAYGSTDSLKRPCLDPRFAYVSRGNSLYVEWLGIQENPYGCGWAAAKNYGFELVNLIKELKATA